MKSQGNAAFVAHDYERAVKLYSSALQMNPTDVALRVTLYSNRA